MTKIDILRNGIIDKLLTINDKNYLSSLLNLIDKSNFNSEKIKLSKEQKILLQLSMKDIQNGEVISNDEVISQPLKSI